MIANMPRSANVLSNECSLATLHHTTHSLKVLAEFSGESSLRLVSTTRQYAGMSAGLPKYNIVNLDDLNQKFNDGEEVSLETLQAKRMLNLSGREAKLPLKVCPQPLSVSLYMQAVSLCMQAVRLFMQAIRHVVKVALPAKLFTILCEDVMHDSCCHTLMHACHEVISIVRAVLL